MRASLSIVFICTLCITGASAEVLVSSFFTNTVERFNSAGNHQGALSGGPGISGPLCARLGPDGLLYVVSEGNDSVFRYDPMSFQYVDTFIATGAGGLDAPTGITWDPTGRAYVSSFSNSNVLRYDGGTGAFIDTFIASFGGGLSGADNGMVFGPDGHLWVPSYNNNRVIRFNGQTGASLGQFGGSILRPRVLVFRENDVLISSETNNAVRRHSLATGGFLGNFIPAGSGGLGVPVGMAMGDDGLLYVGSSVNDRINRYNGVTGAFVDTFAEGTPIDGPTFITIVPEPTTATAGAIMLLPALRRRCRH